MPSLRRWWASSIKACTLIVFILPFISYAATINELRTMYKQAKDALAENNSARYEQLRLQLADYPLHQYLDYQKLSRSLANTDAKTVIDFINTAADSPLTPIIKQRYLTILGLRHEWNTFLRVNGEREPTQTSLRCYYYRALNHVGKKEQAWSGAKALWMSGQSQPDACDPLFSAWHRSGQRSNDDIWGRMQLAYQANEYGLLNYLSRLLTRPRHKEGQLLLKSYRDPAHVLSDPLIKKDTRDHRDIIIAALKRLARKQPQLALKYWREKQPKYTFLGTSEREVHHQIALYLLLRDKPNKWLEDTLITLQDDGLTERYLRFLLSEENWSGVNKWIAKLSYNTKYSDRWHYWQARSYGELNKPVAAKKTYQLIANKRSFYGFLAAEELGLPFQLNDNPLTTTPELPQSAKPALARIDELYAIDEEQQAKYEWRYLINRLDPDATTAVTYYAQSQNWDFMAITGAINAGRWNDMAMRFPRSRELLYKKYAAQQGIDSNLLFAISRRESSFDRYARSYKGARGLMQLMPQTARHISRSVHPRYRRINDLYEPELNLKWGSAYLKELLGRFNGNRITAIAAYNAGPTRVKQWLSKSNGNMPFDVWIESVPFRETREYIEAVLSYQVIYRSRAGKQQYTLLAKAERDAL